MSSVAGLYTFGGFNPLSITGCKLWLKADALVLNDGDAVSTWTDSSGNSNNATGVTTTRPLYKTGIINSKPSVLFDGTDDFLTLTANPSIQPLTVFLVVQPTLNTASQKSYACMAHGDATTFFLVAKLSTNFWGTFAVSDLSSTNALVSGTPYLLENTAASGGVTKTFLYQRGVQVASSGNQESGSGTPGALGKDLTNAGREYAGYIAEVLVYDTVLSSGNRILVENYLIAKYNL